MTLTRAHYEALLEPRGVIVAGAASHPGKFGFVAFHNLRACGFEGALHGTNLKGEPVMGEETYASIAEVPDAEIDLVVACVPASAVPEVIRQAAERGARAVYCAAAGYAEVGADGRAAQDELAAVADAHDVLLVGPNGQGLISTPASLCAQIVAPMPPRGVIGVASQSGGFCSSFGNLARHSGVGISRAVSVGNSAQVGVIDLLEHYVDDPATEVGLAYLEDVDDGLPERLRAVCARMPVVLLRGGRTAPTARAVDVHTGSRAGADGVDDALREAGVTVVASVHEAFRTAATFATHPLPAGPRTVVFGTAGGWGVVTADAVVESGLELIELPDELRDAVNERVPPRWSRGNPIDLAGGETRDTIPELLEIVAAHPGVDGVVYLGIGIQSNQAALARDGGVHPEFGLDRIVDFHERQDARYARAADEASSSTGTPVLTATELALSNPENPGPATVRETGRYCHVAGDEAVRSLEHLWRYARWRAEAVSTA